MSGSAIKDLPRWPSGGNRRKLEAQWLDELERCGLSAYMEEIPTRTPAVMQKAVEQFNARQYWDCHETLEREWLATPYPPRFFYHAMIKVAVGLHHLGRHNGHGARVKLADGVRLLRLFPPVYMGVRADRLLDDASSWLSRVSSIGELDWTELDAVPRPTVELVGSPERPSPDPDCGVW